MKKEKIQALFSQFEQVSCVLNDVECWSARDLCSLLGYKLWQNFTKVIDKAKEACVNVGQNVEDHFIETKEEFDARKDNSKQRSQAIECHGTTLYVACDGYGDNGKADLLMNLVNEKDWGLTIKKIVK